MFFHIIHGGNAMQRFTSGKKTGTFQRDHVHHYVNSPLKYWSEHIFMTAFMALWWKTGDENWLLLENTFWCIRIRALALSLTSRLNNCIYFNYIEKYLCINQPKISNSHHSERNEMSILLQCTEVHEKVRGQNKPENWNMLRSDLHYKHIRKEICTIPGS